MDQPETPAKTEGGAKARWVLSFAVLALAGAVVSLASLHGSASSTTAAQPEVGLAALSQQSPLAAPLYQQLSQPAAVAQAAPAAAAPAVVVPAVVAPAAALPAVTGATTEANASSSMPMSTAARAGATSCVSKDALSAFWAHIESAHLDQSPLQQVQGLLDADNYIKLHTVWLEEVLKPAMDGTAQQVGSDALSAFWAHIESAHLDQSPLQQVQGLLDFDNYVKLHTVWLEQVLKPAVDQLTC